MAPSGLPVVWNLHYEVETISYDYMRTPPIVWMIYKSPMV